MYLQKKWVIVDFWIAGGIYCPFQGIQSILFWKRLTTVLNQTVIFNVMITNQFNSRITQLDYFIIFNFHSGSGPEFSSDS